MKRFTRLLIELVVLLAIYLFGCQLAMWLAWPIPGGVVGLGLLLMAFASGLVKPAALQLGAGVLMAEMLLFFIPALMSLLDYGGLLRNEGWRILLVIGLSTLTVMLVTAFTVELVCRWRLRHEA
ncbi:MULTISPECIES: CidA/LrgA family protein [unclassified Pseudomonas]|uniref:CidA/LrgA family protein n=1 Tax=unclassified Pseudomonas TaxID=196821 RepID=UPI000C86AD08|nr:MULTISPECIES: CidA/LrgA family protein [unclassified Pseudomonas]PMV20912.1 murein hydrolase regulator LrgA [Pseudomonas sp. FW305-3-2-15-C-TSA2]PMV26183.1 murein hydrolase regulator LrgA [Pseudomonas sp. DP16D-L5]PMV37318.1 murein hydrolase regulator LrgA [Pseudomonas sp. FW305-3-2-15-A-LB2]PMV43352.1 murein hydrolase regulator LrgA [Pseudomonas sp. FW305-3-2-15-C-R2A1]PMV50044.1 murein hydrolase regulator LrgA [Pseudomonas sp. FW305-3-2-15-C-LB1]